MDIDGHPPEMVSKDWLSMIVLAFDLLIEWLASEQASLEQA